MNTMVTQWVDSNEDTQLALGNDLPTKPAADYVGADTQLASSPPDQSMEAAGSCAGAEDQSLPVPHVLECIRGARAICGVCAGVSTQDGLCEGFRTSHDMHSLLQVRGFVRIGDPASPHTPQPGPRTHAPMLKSDPRPQHASPDRLSRGTGHVCRGPDLGTWTSHHAPMSWPPVPGAAEPGPREPELGLLTPGSGPLHTRLSKRDTVSRITAPSHEAPALAPWPSHLRSPMPQPPTTYPRIPDAVLRTPFP